MTSKPVEESTNKSLDTTGHTIPSTSIKESGQRELKYDGSKFKDCTNVKRDNAATRKLE